MPRNVPVAPVPSLPSTPDRLSRTHKPSPVLEVDDVHRACLRGHVKDVERLLNKGVDVNARWMGFAPLHCAVDGRHAAVVQLLLQKGAEVCVRDETGSTPLHLAAFYGLEGIVAHLLASGAEPSERGCRGDIPLHLACREGHIATVRLLLTKELLFAKNDMGETPFEVCRTDAIRQILEEQLQRV